MSKTTPLRSPTCPLQEFQPSTPDHQGGLSDHLSAHLRQSVTPALLALSARHLSASTHPAPHPLCCAPAWQSHLFQLCTPDRHGGHSDQCSKVYSEQGQCLMFQVHQRTVRWTALNQSSCRSAIKGAQSRPSPRRLLLGISAATSALTGYKYTAMSVRFSSSVSHQETYPTRHTPFSLNSEHA